TKPPTTWPLRSTPTAPSRSFTATTNQSASPPRIGTQPLAVHPLETLPLTPNIEVVPGQAFSRSVQEQQIGLTSPSCRTPPSQSAGTRWAHPEALHKRPGFDVTSPSNDTSTANP